MFFKKININFISLTTIYSLFITVFYNTEIFTILDERFNISSIHSEIFENFFYFLIFLILFAYLFIFLILFGIRGALKPLIIFLLITSSFLLYFKNVYGVAVNENIILSFTDSIIEKNFSEITDLFSLKLLLYIFFFGILPSLPLFFINIKFPYFKKEFFLRISSMLIMLILLIGLVAVDYKGVSLTVRENKELNQKTIPHYYMMSLLDIVKDKVRFKKEFSILEHTTVSLNTNSKITGIIVLGETARADFFSLNGYQKNTNPNLSKINIVNYNNAFSCGTLTKVSLPCMFYLGDYHEFSPVKATNETNLLDIILSTNTDVSWVDNNSGCKHVCDRVKTIELSTKEKTNYDEILMDHVDQLISESKNNKNLIILHTAGSHGPKYYKRYPEKFDFFKPSCKSNNPQDCTKEELTHAYQNTILYTDYFLSLLIKRLKQLDHESFMIYASDHGESLGEHGLYLHGVPRSIAPKEQIHIPWIMWFSDQYKENNDLKFIDEGTEISHEYFPHTILKALKIESTLYKQNKSLIK